MFTKIRRLPSPALVVAVVALVAALAGSAVALPGKNKVDRNDIQRSAVGGKQVKNDSVTGADVAESTLGTVPSAGSADSAKNANHANHADNATNAANANHAATAGSADHAATADSATSASHLDGVSFGNLFFKAPVSTPATAQMSAEGMVLSVGCNAAGQPIVLVSSTNNASELSGHVVSSGGANFTYADDNGFTNVDIAQTIIGSGTLTYAAGNGSVVTIDYGFDSNTVFNGQAGCAFWGTLVDAAPFAA